MFSASSVYLIICISEGPGRGKTIGGESPVASTGKLGICGLIVFDSPADAPKAGFGNLLSDESVGVNGNTMYTGASYVKCVRMGGGGVN